MKKKQSKKEKAFIAKLKTLNISTGSTGTGDLLCPIHGKPDCAVTLTLQKLPLRHSSDEQSFSA